MCRLKRIADVELVAPHIILSFSLKESNDDKKFIIILEIGTAKT